MDRKIVSSELRRQFFPLLVAGGFERTGDVLRRNLPGPVIHLVEVQHRPRSGVFQVNLGAHLLPLGSVTGGDTPPAETMRDHDCAWRGSIVSGFRNATDSEFAYGATAADAEESVAFLVSEWARQSSEFFGPLTTHPEDFFDGARSSLMRGAHPSHQRTWAQVALLLGDAELAADIAQEALPRVPERATALRADLDALAAS